MSLCHMICLSVKGNSVISVGPTSGRSCLFIFWKLKAPQASQARKATTGSKPISKEVDRYLRNLRCIICIHTPSSTTPWRQNGFGRRRCARFVYLYCFSSYYWNRPFSCEIIKGMVRYEGIHHMFQPNLYIFCMLWQILEQCLPLGKVVSWTTSSGYATMRLYTLPVETSILL